MADQPSIFGTNTQVTPGNDGGSTPPNAQVDPAIATLLASIKNEHGEPKYKTVNDAIIALQHSQAYIPQLNAKLQEKENEIASLRPQLDKMTELEKAVQALTQQKTEAITNANPGLTAEQVANLVNQQLTLKQQQDLAASNLKSVVATVQAKFGTEAEKVFYGKAQELGMSPEEINALAAKNPKAALNLVGMSETQPARTGSPVHSSINAGGFTPQPNSMIGRNDKGVPIGATAQELSSEWHNAKQMVSELEANDLSIDDLTIPKNYFKYFGKKDK